MAIVLRSSGRSVRILLVFCAVGFASLTPLSVPPDAGAAPYVSDIDALIDDSGPLPADSTDLMQTPDFVFTTSTGVVCRKSVIGKVAPSVSCAGFTPRPSTAPPGTRGVTVQGYYAAGDGPARYLSTPPDVTGGQPPVLLPEGHKIVFWAFSNQQSLVCGVPQRSELVCLLKASTERDTTGPEVTHGFVISTVDPDGVF